MGVLKLTMGVLTSITGILGVIGGAVAARYWLVVVVILSILKLVGLVSIPWFAGLTTASAIGTGLWMLGFGLVFVVLGLIVAAISTALLD